MKQLIMRAGVILVLLVVMTWSTITLAEGEDAAPAIDVEAGAALFMAKTCLACHGLDAKTPLLPEYPKIAGQSPAYALQQMKDIKSGARANGQSAAMKGIMHLVNDEEMKILADYVSTLKP